MKMRSELNLSLSQGTIKCGDDGVKNNGFLPQLKHFTYVACRRKQVSCKTKNTIMDLFR
jgi:hypothetical protein